MVWIAIIILLGAVLHLGDEIRSLRMNIDTLNIELRTLRTRRN